jgi:high-affinity Fe2+/Pb2+ permease
MLYISNFVLELINKTTKSMKRAIIIGIVAALVLVTMVLWLVNSNSGIDFTRILMITIQVIVLAFAVVVIYRRISAARQNLPVEDEMSKNILRRGAATSYYASLYLWLAMMFFEESINLERSTLIGAGILGMAIIYALSWAYHNYIRRSNE